MAIECPSCGAALPAEARFCLDCGEPAAAAERTPASYTPNHLSRKILASREALQGERKQITVLFCDVVEWSAHAQRLGPEGMHALLDAFFGLATEHVHRYEGTINQFLGDGFMALFGAPIAHEDHARRAVYAALGLRDAVAQDARLDGVRLRIGINTGAVVVGAIGDHLRMDYTAFGDTTILAARLQVAAEPGHILLGETTEALVHGYFDIEPVESVTVKERTVRRLRVVGVGARRSRVEQTDRRLAPFVGRSSESELLGEMRDRAASGEGTVVGVLGEPGLGKSRLVHEFLRELEPSSARVHVGRCSSYGAGTPYLPVIDLLRATAGVAPADARALASDRIGATLDEAGVAAGAALSFLLQLLGDPDAARQLSELGPAAIKGGTFEALRELWLGLAQIRLLVLVVEDLHWIDRTSEEFLAEFIDELAAAPILLLTTYRPGYNPPWMGKSFATQLALRPLEPDASRQLVDSAANVTEDVAEAIVARGEGNPFFLEELAQAASEQRPDEAVGVPLTVQDVLAARIDRLGDATKRAVQTGAVLGREFTLRLLEAVWDGGADLVSQLQELKRLELIFERRTAAARTFVFKHALTQEVAYESLLERRRRDLHGRAGAALEELYTDQLDEHVELLAHHYACSSDREKAAHYLTLANRKAATRNAMEEAVAYFYEALRALEELPDSPENRARRVALVLDQTGEFHFLHRHREYYDLIVSQEPLVSELGDERLLGSFLARLGHRYWTFARFKDARATLTRAAELCESSGNVQDAAAAYVILAWTYQQLGDYELVPMYTDKALEKLEDAYHPIWYSFARCGALLAYAWTGRFDDAAREADDATRVGDARSDTAMVSINRGFLAYAWMQKRDWARALDEAQASLELAPTPYFRAFPQAFLAATLCRVGDAERGIQILDTIEPIVRATEHWPAWMVIAISRAEALLATGDYERAATALAELVEAAEAGRGPIWLAQSHRLLAECLLATDDDVGAAASHLERAIDVSRSTGMENEFALALAVDGRRLRRLGNETAARARLEEALAIFERLGTLVEPDRLRDELAVPSV